MRLETVSRRTSLDLLAFGSAVAIALLGLLTMNSFQSPNYFFERQTIWLLVSVIVFIIASRMDWRILRRSGVIVSFYAFACVLLGLLFVVGHVAKGASSWFHFGFFAVEPAELANLALIMVLAKYFSRRHIEIGNIRHILISGIYAFVVFLFVVLQPDFGGAIIVFLIWLSMVLVSGISRKHLATVILLGLAVFGALWQFGFQEYQRQRVLTFLHPLADIQGAGYNAYQSTIAVGSGELLGKGIGYGTQSKLRFLPEYQTDFIFAAYAEEWGFLGVVLLFGLFGVLFSSILKSASHGATNFETFFALGVLFYLGAHFALHVGINMGLLPVTGTTIPFMSYGGTHLVVEFLALGIICAQGRYARAAHRDQLDREFVGGHGSIT